MTLPPEIHLMVLEHYLSDKSHYEWDHGKSDKHLPRTSVSSWIGLSLVCRVWRDRVYAIAFQHVCSKAQHLFELRQLDTGCTPHPHSVASSHNLRLTFTYMHTLTVILPHPIDVLPRTILALQDAPALANLSLTIDIETNSSPLCIPSRTISIAQVKCLSLQLSYVRDGYRLPWKAKDIQWILSCFPSTEHLLLNLPRQLCDSDVGQAPEYSRLPNIISLQSNCWIDWLMNPSVEFPNLRSLEVCGDPSPDNCRFIDNHQNTIESLCLADVNHGWAELIPRFKSMRHLSLSYLYNFPWGSVTQWSHLCHFEFLWAGDGQGGSWSEISLFFDSCPSLQAITYHSPFRLSLLEAVCLERCIVIIWRKRHFHEDWRTANQGRWLYAMPYRSWEDVAFYVRPLPPLVKLRIDD